MSTFKLGRKPAQHDPHVAHFSAVFGSLPQPPANVNCYAAVSKWLMLANDEFGDCVPAACFHNLMSLTAYAGNALVPTVSEVLAFYSQVTGFVASDPNSDQGTALIGPGSALRSWNRVGLTCGGVHNLAHSYAQITLPNPLEWQQGISLFGGMLFGMNMPASIMAGSAPPYLWSNAGGAIAGGHCVYLCGYETLSTGRVYDLVSWGGLYRATEEFLKATFQEGAVVFDDAGLNAAGLSGGGINRTVLEASMKALQAAEA